ncbi:DNA cytosine methyltransferase [Pseudoalteromonas umbrosa]|uniref:DNA cytosine methyltransferase n=1 Tax=Pseudoalteromonas umbrosa TaxID=3048489 RepID=UPI0024C28892|nr:DNA cytosine methyltransferase [Pseudoalteromonas sp. B95]MDK1288608.1 DNA cytosine methyltransferase [Pseudoalteromonas sp. B95]
MYEDLIRSIYDKTVATFPLLKQEDELLACISHWLHTPEINFKLRSIELITLWRSEVNDFCALHDTTLDSLLSNILFPSIKNDFSFIDLFAGIGGFKLALQNTGGKCLFSSEWDKSAKQTYFKNHGKFPFGDINQFTGEEIEDTLLSNLIPDHDVLAGGFPCQPFSLAGVSARSSLGHNHGFDCSTQGTLFHSIARIAYVKQPKIIFMENVRNIISHNKGETFKVIRETMENLSGGNNDKQSYTFHFSIINSDTVVAQSRKRCFMVCIRKDIYKLKGEFNFPNFDGQPIPLKEALEELSFDELEEYTISDKLWQGHINRTKRNIDRGTGFTAHMADLNKPSNTIVARYGKDGKECLVPPQREGMNPRKLTKRECANLFGYPKNFWLPHSKTPTYKQLGNSVVVPIVQSISENISEYLKVK